MKRLALPRKPGAVSRPARHSPRCGPHRPAAARDRSEPGTVDMSPARAAKLARGRSRVRPWHGSRLRTNIRGRSGRPGRCGRSTRRGHRALRPDRQLAPCPWTSGEVRDRMSKYSVQVRERRAAETQRMREIQDAWIRSLPPDAAESFTQSVKAARARGPEPRKPDMAPGTAPRPPRPGHEPRPPKEQPRSRGRS